MKLNKKQRIQKFLKIYSYKQIKKEAVFSMDKKAKEKQKIEAKLRSLASGAKRLAGFFRSLASMRGKVYLKKGLAFMTILAVIVTAYWQNGQQVNGAT